MEEDKNIEHFFKKRLESNQFTYEEADWQDLEKKLNAAGIVPVGNALSVTPVKLAVAGILAVSVAFLAGWLLRQETLKDRLLTSTESTISESPLPLQSPPVIEMEHEGKSSSQIASGVNSGQEVNSEPSEHISPPKLSEDPVRTVDLMKVINAKETRFIFSGLVPISPLIISGGPERKIQFPLVLKNAEGRKSLEQKFLERWAVGVSFAPDLNSVGFMSKKSYSPKIGAQIFYRAAERWMISTGLFYSQKRYETTAEGYEPPYGYWKNRTNGIIPDNIFGSCGVVDIPVKMIYSLTDRSRVNFHASAGISTYILLEEAYEFEFNDPNPGADSGWSTTENSNAMAGIANFSLLADMRLSNRLHFIAEPYLQAPLTRIGWGGVDLFSAGALFTLKYQLFENREKPFKQSIISTSKQNQL